MAMNLENVHVRRSDAPRARYRIHLTIGVVASAVLALHDPLTSFAIVTNTVTAILWIWE